MTYEGSDRVSRVRGCCCAWVQLESDSVTLRIGLVGTKVMGTKSARVLAAAWAVRRSSVTRSV